MNLNLPLTQSTRSHKTYATRLEKLNIHKIEDFLYHIPSRYEDYSLISPINQIQPGETITIQGKITDFQNQHLRGNRFKTIQKATVTDNTGSIELTWFNQPYLAQTLLKDATISASGRAEIFGRKTSINNPEYEILTDGQNAIHTARLIPIYPETQGVSSKWLRRQVFQIFQENPNQFSDYIPTDILSQNQFLTFDQAIHQIHFPSNLETATKARERLAFDELFFMQLAAIQRKTQWRATQTSQTFQIHQHAKAIENFLASLPFTLTTAQRQAVDEILQDTTKTKPMNRLLQGDVGSGKTIVATIAMYAAHLSGYQSTLLAPTEILATQHHNTIEKLLSPSGITVGLVTGSKKTKKSPSPSRGRTQGARLLDKGKEGRGEGENSKANHHILIGTHALLSEKIKFNNLALVIIDEQQRFGVEQRSTIRKKGENTHLLTMTATPIPRTVALTMYGDLDVSYLGEMPHGRKKIKTWLVPPEKREGAYDWIRKQIKTTDSQAFIICPFIEESENMTTVKAANKEYERLSQEIYPDLKIGLLHGKQKAKEKDQVLQDFKNRVYDILIATPVVEVGIDIPNATIIMIEAAERFGLSQLHQLRGRVGRGDKQSYCLLFSETKSEQTTQRLKSMETIYAGAELAELDLRLRGPGHIYGVAQHGVPQLKIASFSDFPLIKRAQTAAQNIFPNLKNHPLLKEKLNTIKLENISPD